MKKYVSVLTIAILLPFFSRAQGLADALRYSNFQVQGTARSGGMGNAFGALGGDFTSVSINPAGIGLYRSGELAITPTFGKIDVETNYLGTSMSDDKYKFAFNNISYVTTIPTSNRSESGIVSINVGFGYNRLKDFNSNAIAIGHNASSSFLDHLASNANSGIWDPNYEELAWNTDLLLQDDNNIYWHDIEEGGYGQSQQKSISRRGSINEYTLAMGLNFSHKLYLGASVGIVDLYYKETSSLVEWDSNNSIDYFNEMQFDSYLKTTGTGYNVKFGVIFKPTNEIRLGASIHTPTFYDLDDVFDTRMSSSITDGTTQTYSAVPDYISEYDYDIETPLRATFSGAYIIAKKGLISADVEYVDYGSASLEDGGDGYNFVSENQQISEAYRSTVNFRIGGEYRLTDAFNIRAGYELYPSAYSDEAFGARQPNSDENLNIYSAGLGYRNGGFYFDLAYRHYGMDEYDMLYPAPVTNDYPEPAMAKFNTVKNRFLFTFGFKF